MAEAAVSFLLNNLSLLLQSETNFLGDLTPEIAHIQKELGHMKAFLRVADSKQESDLQIKEWVKQVRDIAYDFEDVLDTYMVHCAKHDVPGIGGRITKVYASLKSLKHHHKLASEIQRIKSKINHATEGYQRYRQENNSSIIEESSTYDGRGDALLLEDADVVGIENPKKQIFQWIFSTDYELKVISLIGMGGLGKTTIVKKVYDDKSVKENFDHHVWITISESYTIVNLLRSLINFLVDEIEQTKPPNFELMKVDEMKQFIYNFLQHERYIIVLDDIWSIDAWEAIKYAFPRSMTRGCGCIIITTRLTTVGNAMSGETKGHVFMVEPLPKDEAKKLFHSKAFLGQPCPDVRLLNFSEIILRRCAGLPLAIVLIGALLATKNHKVEEWDMFARSLGNEFEADNLKRMNTIFSLSYYDLPYYLKSCFLYLSFFPEDEFLERWRLIRLWIAEGFVTEKSGKTLEEVAHSYINELANRSLIQVAKISIRGGECTHFRIHDLVREYIILKSRHEVLIRRNGKDIASPNKIRRVTLDDSFNDIPDSYKFESLRSLMWVGSGDFTSGGIIHKLLGKGCMLLKQLDLRGAPIKVVPDEVFKLYHLKYLSLRNTMVKDIPRSIKYLQNLETLDLKHCYVTQLPIEVTKLHKLRHLLVYRYQAQVGYCIFEEEVQGFEWSYNIGHLSSLQKLVHLKATEVNGVKTVREIGKLTQLRKLGLTRLKKEDGADLCRSLAKMTNLRSLLLTANGEEEVMDLDHSMPCSNFLFLRTLILHGRLEKVPNWIGSLDGLNRLDLRWSRVAGNAEDPLKNLYSLPNLQELRIDCAYEGEKLNFKVKSFPKLKRLSLERLGKLKRVSVEEGSMPLLEELWIMDCKLIEDVPEGIQYLSNLRDVQFTDISQDFVHKLREHRRKGNDAWKLDEINWEKDPRWRRIEARRLLTEDAEIVVDVMDSKWKN